MKLQTLLESEKGAATLFFNCDFYYEPLYDEEIQKKNGDLRFTVVFPSAEEATDFVAKCRTNLLERFFKDFMENGSETLLEQIVNNSSAADEYGVLHITKVEIDGDIAMSHDRGKTYPTAMTKQNTDNSKWYYDFFFEDLKKFVHTLAWCSGESIVNKHFGSANDMLDTLTL